jgi:hypothetical protein
LHVQFFGGRVSEKERGYPLDMPEIHRCAFGNGTAGHGTDVGAATLTTKAHARWSEAFAISADTVAGGSPER